ncbi:Protein of unknown function [Algibacter pectinivorans]|uniref:DUF3124 domain-containing protein n=2 Tax=Algibacter pectinivorans TaxID=870482 RepID=A0A1I1P0W6_9FLAO|nr:Protein of unknown function [Algibacter pectinivorans]
MTYKMRILFFCILTLILNSCQNQNPNLNKSGEDELKSLEVEQTLDKDLVNFKDLIYVPIYSDIYIDNNNPEHLLAATLSIRNTSINDTLYISKIDYYNTGGTLVKNYINNTIILNPMATVNYVIEKEDTSGGSGANFIVEVSAKNRNTRPLIQAIMIGQFNNKSFSFSTDGYSISDKTPALKTDKK